MRPTVRTWPIAAALCLCTAWAVHGQPQSASGLDWPQWRGPERSGVSRETGLLQAWPAGGPARGWAARELGAGYGAVAVSGAHVYVQGLVRGQSVVHAIDRATGRLVWSRPLGRGGTNDRGSGPRSTPTVDGERLYVLTESGDLACLDRADGRVVWTRNILRDFGGRNIDWLISESPLVDGDRVIVTPGGRGAGMVALDKTTGAEVWRASELNDPAGYASAVAADVGGVRAIMTLTSSAGIGVRAADGKLLWRYTRVANGTANVATPVVEGNRVFYTSNYGVGGALLTLVPENGALRAEQAYFTRDLQNHHGGVVLVNGHLYGFDGSILTAMEFSTGRVAWQHRSVGKGAVAYADNRLYIVGENHVVGLAEVTPAGYRETGRFTIEDRGWPAWAHPVISGGRLYVRNQDMLTAYDVRAR